MPTSFSIGICSVAALPAAARTAVPAAAPTRGAREHEPPTKDTTAHDAHATGAERARSIVTVLTSSWPASRFVTAVATWQCLASISRSLRALDRIGTCPRSSSSSFARSIGMRTVPASLSTQLVGSTVFAAWTRRRGRSTCMRWLDSSSQIRRRRLRARGAASGDAARRCGRASGARTPRAAPTSGSGRRASSTVRIDHEPDDAA